MKNIIILALGIIGISSCATFIPQQRTDMAFFLDYRPYLSEGFFISPDPYVGDFEPLGELYVEVIAGQKEVRIDSEGNVKGEYDNVVFTSSGAYGSERIMSDELLDIAVQKAKSIGANGISGIKFRKVAENSQVRYEVTGLCIRR